MKAFVMTIFNKMLLWMKIKLNSKSEFEKLHFAKQYRYKVTVELLKVIDKRVNYNPVAVEAAIEEIK